MTSSATPTVEHDITKDEVKQIEEDEWQRRSASLHERARDMNRTHTSPIDARETPVTDRSPRREFALVEKRVTWNELKYKSRLDIQDLERKARQERLKDEVQATIEPTPSAKQSLDH
ncbi:hypothetical protein M427DRAFT_31115 [Gonapodya prolifera JEL478]|uniref:Uncharacterized protein n=1 Tax=Gonapodya prolifera (strain JEL478) TaxID=1344416 RepID=A0A139AJ27_GONPJ|nr:hypothetical protein M427DRAFT_31115 [Gonapodya prolifera JEL478]|eukprot:KXS16729.1 hypothetical protein M427DRAFT_31115 [Gonapodya prolifera JEL478]